MADAGASMEQYRANLTRAQDYHGQLGSAITSMKSAVVQADAFDWVRYLGWPYYLMWQALRWLIAKAIDMLEWIYQRLANLLREFVVPLEAYADVERWKKIGAYATEVVGDLKNLDPDRAYLAWTGEAATAYRAQVQPQVDAANRIAATTEKVSGSLNIFAGACAAFLAGLALLAYRVVTTAIQAGILIITKSIITLKDVIRDLITLVGIVITVIGADVVLFQVIHTQGANLRLLAADTADFPGGHWPDPTGGTVHWPAKVTATDGHHDMQVQPPAPVNGPTRP